MRLKNDPRLKYKPEELRRYLSEHPTATCEEMAKAFSGSVNGVKSALVREKISLLSLPGRKNRLKYNQPALKSYFASHPDATRQDTIKHFNGKIDALDRALKRFGIKTPMKTNRYGQKRPNSL